MSPDEYILIDDCTKCWVGRLADIIVIRQEGNYAYIHTSDRRLLRRGSLSDYEKRLPSGMFFRASRSWMVNLSHVKEVEKQDPKRIRFVMDNQSEVVASRSRSALFRKTRKL